MLYFNSASMIYGDESTLSPMAYADRFKEGLKRPGKDRKGAAKAMGISVQAVGAIANGGTKSATAENNAKAAAYFGCDPTWLASGKGLPGWSEDHAAGESGKQLLFRDLNPFESQFITLFRQLSDDEQHDELVRLNQRVDRAAQEPSAQNPWKGRLDRRHADRREDADTSSTEARKVE